MAQCRRLAPLSASEVYSRYADLVCAEAESRSGEILASTPRGGADTLYIGGGTPSLLPEDDLARIFEACRRPFPSAHTFEEFTIEVNPEDIVVKGPSYAAALKALGCGRISMGVQSFDASLVKWMRRRHDPAGSLKAYSILRDAGFEDISLDLIFGISGLDMDRWASSLDTVCALRPEHISAYQLSVEKGARLYDMWKRGEYAEASDEVCRSQYELLCHRLKEAGYLHYEISNFALPGHQARHNSAYWRRVPYVGLGLGAHSFSGKSRSWNKGSWLSYSAESETLSGEDVRVEEIMLSLRTSRGMDAARLESLSSGAILRRLEDEGALRREGGRIYIPEDHFFVSDEIIGEIV